MQVSRPGKPSALSCRRERFAQAKLSDHSIPRLASSRPTANNPDAVPAKRRDAASLEGCGPGVPAGIESHP